ncbi:unnamed protein product [Gongylonema pulchrum]|uniref:RBR-type E3 ubiquitin transferase n=1 Tax=Gongylonema pulchrum TaxID=637853 RepID=A0A183EF61_9BILA|nr:unnamed protein product [Gongylonema pulchrum]
MSRPSPASNASAGSVPPSESRVSSKSCSASTDGQSQHANSEDEQGICDPLSIEYLQVEIMESRVQLTCPECTELMHPSDIYSLMANCPEMLEKYETFALRRALMMDPDTRWCPAPDCTFVSICRL